MLFSSFTFIFAFLPLVLLLYYCGRGTTYRNSVLLVASVLFYAWGEPLYVLVLLLTVFITWLGALLVYHGRGKRLSLGLSLAALIGILVYFKYTNFLLENLNALLHHQIDPLYVVMPIGISFYTFQAVSYLIDVARGEVEVQRNPFKLTLYITLFPQLVAGPIVKYHDICLQLDNRRESLRLFTVGARRFLFGLAKKVLIANTLGAVATPIFALPADQLDCLTAWGGAAAFTLQLYYDFSGYSDMAIGLCLLFGFRIPENFNYPFISRSITEWWRRWHISLSTWFKEYLYFPLGGNRAGVGRTYFNLFVVFLATGVWHGASWNFVLWGIWNGIFILIERVTGWYKWECGPVMRGVQHVYAPMIFLLGMVLFNTTDMTHCAAYFQAMTDFSHWVPAERGFGHYTDVFTLPAAIIGVLFACPLASRWATVERTLPSVAVNIWCLLLGLASAAALTASTFNPFIYFRF